MEVSVFSHAEALASGLSRRDIAARLGSGEWVEIRRSIYVAREDLDRCKDPVERYKLDICAALKSLKARAVVSHESAAVMHGLPLMNPPRGFDPMGLGEALPPGVVPPDEVIAEDPGIMDALDRYFQGPRTLVTLTRPTASGRAASPGVRFHYSDAAIREINIIDGIAVTTLEWTAVDLARTLSFRDALVVVDAALWRGREERTTKGELLSVIRNGRIGGNTRARDIIEFATDLAESPLESCARLAFRDLGLPAPVLQCRLADRPEVRVDFCWPEHWTVVETDGRSKYASRKDLWREKVREDRLRELGWEVIRLTWNEVFGPPEAVGAKISAAFRRAHARRRA